MAHELIKRGVVRAPGEGNLAVAYAGVVPWYGLADAGEAMPDGTDVDAWIARSGLDRIHVEACEAWARLPQSWGHGSGVRCAPEVARLLVERTTGQVFASCGPSYTPVQFCEIVDAMRPLISSGRASLSCLAPLRGGRTMFATLLVGSGEVSRNERIDWYLVATSSHDGTSTIRFYLTAIRVVCANTLDTSLNNRFATIAIRHTPSATDRLAAFGQAVASTADTIEGKLTAWRAMSSRRIVSSDVTRFAAAMVPERPEAGERAKANDVEARAEIARLYEVGAGADLPGVRGTVWGLYQAATAYASHVRTARADAEGRIRSLHEGVSADLIGRAEAWCLDALAA